jgi:hypothetical protein
MQEHLLSVAGMLARPSRMQSRKAGESCDTGFASERCVQRCESTKTCLGAGTAYPSTMHGSVLIVGAEEMRSWAEPLWGERGEKIKTRLQRDKIRARSSGRGGSKPLQRKRRFRTL